MIYHITNNTAAAVPIAEIPVVDYMDLYNDLAERMTEERYHVAHYFATEVSGGGLRFYLLLLDDMESTVMLSSFIPDYYSEEGLASLSALHPAFHPFEREIHELYGIKFNAHPWCKPLRFAFDRCDRNSTMHNYPFYEMNGSSLLEVNVGTIHAGILEPGAV
ncbi:MAG: NADH-quinone oxidoreductase subunit C, partial [Alistipes sp.]|nr:NADH-quinone oxidoreductase subunit C [Alistipes sp.]